MLAAMLAASAGEAKPTTPYSWSGFYVGIHGGAAFADVDVTPGSLSPPGTEGTNVDADGALFGALAGYNFQNGSFVYGLEGDVSFGEASGSNLSGVPSVDIDFAASARLRAGVVFDNALVFATAGYGLVNADGEENHGSGWRGSSETHGGLVLGIGGEWAVDNDLILRAEYQHGFFDEKRYAFPESVLHTHGIEFDTDVVRLAAIWRFN